MLQRDAHCADLLVASLRAHLDPPSWSRCIDRPLAATRAMALPFRAKRGGWEWRFAIGVSRPRAREGIKTWAPQPDPLSRNGVGSRGAQLPASSTDASSPVLFLAVAATAALAADPRIVTVPDQAPPQAPAPSPASKPLQPVIPRLGEPPEAKPQAGQGGTEQAPLFVRILPQPKTVVEAEAERREQDARAANDRGLTKYTLYLWRTTAVLALVAAVQAGLFVWQLVLIRRSLAEAKTC